MIRSNRNFYWKDIIRDTKGNIFTICIFLFIVAVIGLLMQNQIARRLNLDAPQYNGKVVDKWRSVNETYEGSLIKGVILVEDNTGTRHQIQVSENVYSKTKIGDPISNSSGMVKFASE